MMDVEGAGGADEYWVMRVIGPQPKEPGAQLLRDIASGALAVGAGGELLRPLYYERDHESALVAAQREHARSGCVHVVTLCRAVDVAPAVAGRA